MDWNDIAKLVSALTQNPITTLIVVICVIFLLEKIDNGFGIAFRDIPKHLTEVIIATYNFILSLLRREQIGYPPNYTSTHDTDNEKDNSNSAKKSLKDKIGRAHV